MPRERRFNRPPAMQPGEVLPGLRGSQDAIPKSDASRCFASREQLCCELGEGEEFQDGILPRPARAAL
jgi:hypothetical protein